MNLEPLYAALFAFLSGIVDAEGVPVFRHTTRILQPWSNFTDEMQPTLCQTQLDEDESERGPMGPARLECRAGVTIWYKFGEPPALSSPQANLLIGYVRQALKATQIGPDGKFYPKPIGSKQTLGGKVENCYIKGRVVIDEGVLDHQGCVFIPIVFIMGDVSTPRP